MSTTSKVNADLNVKLDQLYIVPGRNPRTIFTKERIKELKVQIKAAGGILVPLVVEPLQEVEIEGKKRNVYPVIAGETRIRALKELAEEGISYSIPVHIEKTKADAKRVFAVSVLSNEGAPLDAIDMAFAVKRYLEELGGSRPELCEMLGKTSAWISQRMDIVAVCEEDKSVISKYRQGKVSTPDILAIAAELKKNKPQKGGKKGTTVPSNEQEGTTIEATTEPAPATPSAAELVAQAEEEKERKRQQSQRTRQQEKDANVTLNGFEKQVLNFLGGHGLDGLIVVTAKVVDVAIKTTEGKEKRTWQNMSHIVRKLEETAGVA